MHLRAYVGRTLRPKEPLLDEEAVEIARQYLREPEELLSNFYAKIITINPDFVRYAYTEEGQRLGLTAALAISDDAYEATIRGGRGPFDFTMNDIVPRSNNIVMLSYAETPNDNMKFMSLLNRRIRLQAKMMQQVALLLDPPMTRPIRLLSFDIIPANSKRLKMTGFCPATDKYGQEITVDYFNGPVRVLDFDPAKRNLFAGNSMMLIDKALRVIRKTIDGRRA